MNNIIHIIRHTARAATVLQHQHHLLAGNGNEVQSLRGGYFDYGGSDEDYDEGAR